MITTMYVGVSQSLPKTNGIKMIDYWLIFNLLVPFIEVIIHIQKDMKANQEKGEEKKDVSTLHPLVMKKKNFLFLNLNLYSFRLSMLVLLMVKKKKYNLLLRFFKNV